MSAATRRPARRRGLALVLVVLFVVVPLVEIATIIQVGQVIGPWWTILLLVLDSIVGAWLVRREGGRAWRALTQTLQSGRMPSRELADGALILVGGTLMLTPGFATDLVGLLLVLPPTRPIARRVLARVVAQRLVVATFPGPDMRHPGAGHGGGPVIRGDVVEEDDR